MTNPKSFIVRGIINPEPFTVSGFTNSQSFRLCGVNNPQLFRVHGMTNPQSFRVHRITNPKTFRVHGITKPQSFRVHRITNLQSFRVHRITNPQSFRVHRITNPQSFRVHRITNPKSFRVSGIITNLQPLTVSGLTRVCIITNAQSLRVDGITSPVFFGFFWIRYFADLLNLYSIWFSMQKLLNENDRLKATTWFWSPTHAQIGISFQDSIKPGCVCSSEVKSTYHFFSYFATCDTRMSTLKDPNSQNTGINLTHILFISFWYISKN